MIIIGEKINASRKSVKPMITERNRNDLLDLATRQVQAGASFIDVNVGTGTGSKADEIAAMEWAVGSLAAAIDKPLCIDSADPEVLEAGLRMIPKGSAIINSTKAEDTLLGQIVALAAKYEAQLIGLAMDESGIPGDVEGRLRACEKIAHACDQDGVPLERVLFDPLVLPVSTDITQGLVTLETITRIKSSFPGARTVAGLSNVSFGLPARAQLNSAFMILSIHAGLDAAIADPLNEVLMSAVSAAEALLGRDRHCRRYIRAFRK
jgi:5-methyltetrahydrofolate--homocysteine methyltransferase